MADTDFDVEDIRKKLIEGAPAPDAYKMDSDSPEDDSSDEVSTPAAAPAPATPKPAPVNPQLAAYLQNKEEMKAAQGKASMNQLLAGIGRASSTLAHSTYASTDPVDSKAFDNLDQAAQAPVKDLVAQQATGEQAMKQQKELDASDPNSAASQAFRKSLKLVVPNIAATYGDSFDLITAADAPNVMKTAELKGQIDQRQEAAQQRAVMTNAIVQGRRDAAQEKTDKKTSDDQDKNYTQLRKDLESFRGNKAVAQAAQDIYSADKALEIVKNKNPDTLTVQDLNLLANEMGKVASGGVPGEHGVQALLPNNLKTKYSELMSFIASKPTDAQAGDYVKRNMQYLQGMTEQGKKMLGDYRSNIMKGYRDRVKPEKFSEAQSDYSLGTPAAPAASDHPEADAAADWAKKNPNDPRAKTILQRLAGVGQGAAL